MSGEQPRSTQMWGVQGLRFLAALAVVVEHALFYTHERLDRAVSTTTLGGTGVDVFFVISGFVMVMSSQGLIGSADGWKRFMMRRVVRIVPLYWIATTVKLAALLAVPVAVLHSRLDWGDVGLSYLFLPSRNIDGLVQPLLGVGWTLVYEMFFYAVFTVALFVRVNPVWFCGVILSALSFAHMFRPGDDWNPFLVYLDPIVAFFLAGMLIARFAITRDVRNLVLGLSWVLLVRTVVWYVTAPNAGLLEREHVVRAVFVIGLVLVTVLGEERLRRWLPQSVIHLGDASYSLYLTHPLLAPLVPVILLKLGLVSGPLSVVLTIVVAIGLALVIYPLLEKPITRRLQTTLPYAGPRRTDGAARPQAPAVRIPHPARPAAAADTQQREQIVS